MYTIAYADDLTVLINGKFEEILCQRITNSKKYYSFMRTMLCPSIPLTSDVKYFDHIRYKTKMESSFGKDTKKAYIYEQCCRTIGKTKEMKPNVVIWTNVSLQSQRLLAARPAGNS